MLKRTFSAIITIFLPFVLVSSFAQQRSCFVSAAGSDNNSGTREKPLLTIHHALSEVEKAGGEEPVSIFLLPGKYYLPEPLLIHPMSFPLTISAMDLPGKVILSGAGKQSLKWKFYKKGINYARYTGRPVDELYINGVLYHMARYPDFDSTQRVYNGTADDAIAPERVKTWRNPEGGYVHALHQGEWGDMHYRITGKKGEGELSLTGGWQNNRPAPMNKKYRYVENIFEELNAEGEWYYKAKKISDTLVEAEIYCIPINGIDLSKALVELSRLDELIIISGTPENPVKNVTLKGISFTQTNRTFMQTEEPLLRSDWTIYRGAAVRLAFAENCSIINCSFENLGGNALFVSNYNRNHVIRGNLIRNTGASGVCFAGSPEAIRSPLFRYGESLKYEQLDLTPGPATGNYPSACLLTDNLIHHTGSVEKQSAGVQVSMASEITISHNTIYNTPRAGINVSEGTWGGHLIEFNEVFNTVLETGDHGAFNSWGRDRYWNPDRQYMDKQVAEHPGLILLDARKTTVIRNNVFRCDHGWDIDLDDGSSNYHIYNNICLNGGLKLREGFYRTAENNILVNNTFHPHVWFKNSGDVFKHNIVSIPYAPIGIRDAPVTIDSNFFLSPKGLQEARTMGTDINSLSGNPCFRDQEKGDYFIQPGSPVFTTGFLNFESGAGVQDSRLKNQALKAPVSKLILSTGAEEKSKTHSWLGASIKNIDGPGEQSAAGLPDENGVLVLNAGEGLAAGAGLHTRDVICTVEGKIISRVSDFFEEVKKYEWTGKVRLSVFRNQQAKEINVILK